MAGTAASNTVSRVSSGWRPRALLVGALLWMPTGVVLAQTPWPRIAIPDGVILTDMGGQVSANGMPLQMRGFTAAAAPARVAALFRQSLGQPLVENRLGARQVLGRSYGAHYLTVQLEATAAGTRGVIALTGLTAAVNGLGAARDGDRRLLARLAAGFGIVSRTASDDTRRRAEHIVLTNTHSVGLSAESIKSMLHGDGFTLERETVPVNQLGAGRGGAAREGRTLFFAKPGGEAVAVISRDAQGRTAVVLNTISHAERSK